MNGRSNRIGWAMLLLAVVLGTAAAAIAYNVGVSHGLTAAGADAAARGAGPYYRPWGFGVAFPLLFFAFVFFAFVFFAFARCRRPWVGYWGSHGRWPVDDSHWMPPAFEEWHRRAHDAMKEPTSADDSRRRG